MAFTDDQPTPNNSSDQQDDATGIDQAAFTASGFAQDDATGIDAQATNIVTGFALPDLALPNSGSIYDKAGSGLDITDPSASRLKMSGLLPGGARAMQKQDPTVEYKTDRKGIISHDSDWRVRITLPKAAKIFYQHPNATKSIMAPLVNSGVIFPYTPQIQVTHMASYESQGLTHANYQSYFYKNSEVQQISISGDFTAQNHDEARYVLAVIYFFRAATKMFYGSDQDKTGNVGAPPPIVFLNGYGKNYFPNVPCVITNFQHTMPGDVDYIPVISPVAYGSDIVTQQERRPEETRIPTLSQLTVTLQPIYSRKNIYDNFSLDDFAQGKLLGNKIGGTGGFI